MEVPGSGVEIETAHSKCTLSEQHFWKYVRSWPDVDIRESMKELLRKGTQQELAEVFRVASELRGFSAAARAIGQAHHVIQRTVSRIVDTHEQAQAELEQTPIGP